MGKANPEYKLVRRKFNFDAHYDIVGSWWKHHGSRIPPQEFLSRTGLVIYADDDPVAAGFLYSTDSAFCYFAFVVVNPESKKEKRNNALEFLIKSAREWAHKSGFKAIICNSEYRKFSNRLKDQGFFIPVKNVDHLFCLIEET